jgi:energy-coupling factor transporter ATP-binding protein EcfA2
LQFLPSGSPGCAELTLPQTRPLVVEASWTAARGERHSDVVVAEPGTTMPLEDVCTSIVLRTLAGRRFRCTQLPPTDAGRVPFRVICVVPPAVTMELPPDVSEPARDVLQIQAAGTDLGVEVDVLVDSTSAADLLQRLTVLVRGPDAVVVHWAGPVLGRGDAPVLVLGNDEDDVAILPVGELMDRILAAGPRESVLLLPTPAATPEHLRDSRRLAGLGTAAVEGGAAQWSGCAEVRMTPGGSPLARALRDGPDVYRRPWNPRRPLVRLSDLFDLLTTQVPGRRRGSDAAALPGRSLGESGRRASLPRHVPNPRHDATVAAEIPDPQVFIGRRRLMTELVSQIHSRGTGLWVVSGPPGSGKSALLRRLAGLSEPGSRDAIEAREGLPPPEADPTPHSVDAAVSLGGGSLEAVATALGRQLGLPPDPDELVAQLRGSPDRPVIVFDALDETRDWPHVLDRLVAPICDTALVLAATRSTALDPLIGRVPCTIRDLADEPDTLADLSEYVARQLENSGQENVREIADQVALLCAQDGFLAAHQLIEYLRTNPVDTTEPGWRGRLSRTVAGRRQVASDSPVMGTAEAGRPEMRITVLGQPASGKTTYTTGMWAALSGGRNGVFINAEFDRHVQLADDWDRLISSGTMPQATVVPLTTRFVVLHQLRPLLTVDWLDCPFALLHPGTPNSSELAEGIARSDSIHLVLDGQAVGEWIRKLVESQTAVAVGTIEPDLYRIRRRLGIEDLTLRVLAAVKHRQSAGLGSPTFAVVLTKRDVMEAAAGLPFDELWQIFIRHLPGMLPIAFARDVVTLVTAVNVGDLTPRSELGEQSVVVQPSGMEIPLLFSLKEFLDRQIAEEEARLATAREHVGVAAEELQRLEARRPTRSQRGAIERNTALHRQAMTEEEATRSHLTDLRDLVQVLTVPSGRSFVIRNGVLP